MTARHAMGQLAEEGLVRRDPGRGTFVAEPPTHRRANFLMTFSHEMRRQGRVPTSRIVRRIVRPPTEPERGGPARRPVATRSWSCGACALPTAIRWPWRRPSWLPAAPPTVMAADLETGSLHEALIGAGMVPSRGRASIGAEAASPDDARLLGVPAGCTRCSSSAGSSSTSVDGPSSGPNRGTPPRAMDWT